MGVVSLKGGSQEVVKLMATTQFKMEDVCNFCNVTENFCLRKVTKTKDEGLLVLLNSKWHWHNHLKTH
jgi:hypothetical protein